MGGDYIEGRVCWSVHFVPLSPGHGAKDEIGIKPFRRVLLLVNPVGGKGKARSIVKDKVLPFLEAAGCQVDLKGGSDCLHELMYRNKTFETC